MTALVLLLMVLPYLLLALASLRTYLAQRREQREWTARTGRPWPDCLKHAPRHTYPFPFYDK